MKNVFVFLSLNFVIYGAMADSLEPDMVYINENVSGVPVQDYVNIWWQWAFSVPKEANPVRDRTGENCSVGQKGDVWFLAGGYGSSKIKRTCVVPSGKYIFFPIINMAYWPKKEKGISCERAKKLAALNNDHLLNIQVTLDDKVSWNPADARISSRTCFDMYGRVPEKYNAPKLYPAATDGYWVMLKPLAQGTHKLKFSASYNREGGAYGKMAQDIEYTLEIN